MRRTASRLKLPAIVALVTGLGSLALTRHPAFGTLMFVAAFAAAVAVVEILRAAGGRSPRAIRKTITRNPTRYGGYLVHIGIAVMVLGFAGSLFRTQTEVAVSPGESFRFAGYTMKFQNLQRFAVPDKDVNLAVLDVYRGSRKVITLRPQLNLHANFDQPQSEIAIRSTPAADLYVILAGTRLGSDDSVFRVYNNPLVFWVWFGTALSLGGALVALLAGRRRATPLPSEAPVKTSEPQWTP